MFLLPAKFKKKFILLAAKIYFHFLPAAGVNFFILLSATGFLSSSAAGIFFIIFYYHLVLIFICFVSSWNFFSYFLLGAGIKNILFVCFRFSLA